MSNTINLNGKKLLLLAEKPSVMRAIQAIYNKESATLPYTMEFGAFHGHVMGLKSPEEYNPIWKKWEIKDLPLLPDCTYKATDPAFVRDMTAKIKAGKYDFIVNACDAGREGELIFWAYYKTAGHNIPVIRYWANSNADSAIKKSLNDLRPYTPTQFEGLKESSFLRAEFDWLVGMNFSRGASIPIGNPISVGRVQSPTLRMVVDRELAIKSFVPETFYELEGVFFKSDEFTAMNMVAPAFTQTRYNTQAEAETVKAGLGNKGIVSSVKQENKESHAPALFSLVELQKAANKAFKMTPDATLANLQKLYEAGYVTYPRTESRYLPSAMVPELPKAIKSLEILPALGAIAKRISQADIDRATTGKRYIDDGRIEDHHAIIPTDKVPTSLFGPENDIYNLVTKQFLAIFMSSCKTLATTIIINVGPSIFKTEGTVVIDKGYTEVLGSEKKDKLLPALTEKDEVDLRECLVKTGKTTPPARYTPATLLAAMQNAGREVDDKEHQKILKDVAGIGTSATRAAILDGLIKKQTLILDKNFYIPTDIGIYNAELLKSYDFTSPILTAVWEQKLQEVEKDPAQAVVIKQEMVSYVSQTVATLKTLTSPTGLAKPTSNTNGGVAGASLGKCPHCSGEIQDRKFSYMCNSCDFKFSKTILTANITKTDAKALISGKSTKPKKFKNAKGEFKATIHFEGKSLKFKSTP